MYDVDVQTCDPRPSSWVYWPILPQDSVGSEISGLTENGGVIKIDGFKVKGADTRRAMSVMGCQMSSMEYR